MKERIQAFFIVAFLLLCHSSYAQKENHVWAFSKYTGLDFNTVPPSVTSTAITTKEGCASICDLYGNLLFYSNGIEVWDRTHNVMPDGSGLLGSPSMSSTMGVAIAAIPNKPNLYFLFTIDAEEDLLGILRYSMIDMSLNSGKGDIVPGIKNIELGRGMSEKMIVGSACGTVWLVTHGINIPVFYAYRISGIIISPPVISTTAGLLGTQYRVGEMKFSPDFRQIAIGNYQNKPSDHTRLELFDFDNRSGRVSGYHTIDTTGIYSVEFSPDGRKLYTTTKNNTLYQYDLSLLPDETAVRGSRYTVSMSGNTGLRRGPDKKIYLLRAAFYPFDICRINSPDIAGAGCRMETGISSLENTGPPNGYLSFGNNTVRAQAGESREIISYTESSLCSGQQFTYTVAPGHELIQWHDGDTSGKRTFTGSGTYWVASYKGCNTYRDTLRLSFAPSDTGTSNTTHIICEKETYIHRPYLPGSDFIWNDGDTSAERIFTKSGQYWLTKWNKCKVLIDTLKIIHLDNDTLTKLTDTVVCFQQQLDVDAGSIDGPSLWNDGSTGSTSTFFSSGTKWVLRTEKTACVTHIDTFKVKMIDFNITLKDSVLCSGSTIVLDAAIGEAASYLWQDQSRQSSFKASQPGNYSVSISVDCCNKTASVQLESIKTELGPDRVLCEGQTLMLQPPTAATDYLWQDGSTKPSFTVHQAGIYHLKVSKMGCVEEDSIRISYLNCKHCIAIPNAFTPNNDGRNDRFGPLLFCPARQYALVIVNRYGQPVFKSSNPEAVWDGQCNNNPLESGVYYYLLQIAFDYPGSETEIHKGDLTLIR